MADQMSMPMTVNEISVHGAKNIRRGFLDPIFSPLLRDGSSAPSTVGDVMAKLQMASSKLSGLRELPAHRGHRTGQNHLLTARRDSKRTPGGILVTSQSGRPLYEPKRCQHIHWIERTPPIQTPNWYRCW